MQQITIEESIFIRFEFEDQDLGTFNREVSVKDDEGNNITFNLSMIVFKEKSLDRDIPDFLEIIEQEITDIQILDKNKKEIKLSSSETEELIEDIKYCLTWNI